MAELKTKQNDADVGAFLDGIENEKRREDCRAVVELMADVTGEPAAMWGDSIIGFGSYHYKYATGREGDWMADRRLAAQAEPDRLHHDRFSSDTRR